MRWVHRTGGGGSVPFIKSLTFTIGAPRINSIMSYRNVHVSKPIKLNQ